jgi:hypothetical protein
VTSSAFSREYGHFADPFGVDLVKVIVAAGLEVNTSGFEGGFSLKVVDGIVPGNEKFSSLKGGCEELENKLPAAFLVDFHCPSLVTC